LPTPRSELIAAKRAKEAGALMGDRCLLHCVAAEVQRESRAI